MSDFIPKSLQNIPTLDEVSVFERLAWCERVCDGLTPARELSFDDLYERWQGAMFFKVLGEFGHVSVAYNGGEVAPFEACAKNGNRHQALALSCFLASRYANSKASVSSPHELGDTFTAVFERTSPTSVTYTTVRGLKVVFTFDNTKPSQF